MRKGINKGGRPAGVKSEKDPPVVELVTPSRCPRCGSGKRSDYWSRHVQEFAGVLPDGRPYTRIVRQRCRCSNCGQIRVDKRYEIT